MGVSIRSKKHSVDMGYGGFKQLRKKVAELTNETFFSHYQELLNKPMMFDTLEEEKFYQEYDAKTQKLINEGIISEEVANFCYQSDCDGGIDQNQAKIIYNIIKDYDDEIMYGYSGRPDCAMFKDFKNIIKDCADNGGEVEWY